MAVDPGILSPFKALKVLTDSDIAGLARNLESMKYRSGALLCREGSAGTSCYFLTDGGARVTRRLPDGRRVRLAALGAGALFGQSGLINDQVRTADVIAEGDTVVLTLDQRRLTTCLEDGEVWAVAFQKLVAIHLVRQLRSALERLNSLALQEDPSWIIEGKARSEVPVPQPLDVDFTKWQSKGPKAKIKQLDEDFFGDEPPASRAAPTDEAPWERSAASSTSGPPRTAVSQPASVAQAQPEITDESIFNMDDVLIDPHGEGGDEDAELLRLLQATEADICTSFELQTISVVMDEDQRRTAEARNKLY